MRLPGALRIVADSPAPAVTAAATPASIGADPKFRVGIRSPWTSSRLSKLIFDDLFGFVDDLELEVARGDALTIPAVTRALSLITSSIADCPLIAVNGQLPGTTPDVPLATQPKWLTATDTDVAPQYRMALTVDDLVCYGWALWSLTRLRGNGEVTAARRVWPDHWAITDEGVVEVDDVPQKPADYVLFKGPHDGILLTGRRALRGALNVERAWQRWIENPIPTTVIKATDDTERDDDEIDELLGAWLRARQLPGGAVAYIPANLDVEALGSQVSDLLTEARNASAVDIARLAGLPAVAIDAGPVQTSLTYANTETANGTTLPLYGLAPYARCIGYALSLDSITPAGTRIAVDLSQMLADAATISRTGTQTED